MSRVSNKHEGTVVFSGVLQWTGRVNNLNRNPVVHLHEFQQNTKTWIHKIRLCYFHKCFREHKCAHTWSQLSMAAMSRPTVWVWLTASGYSCWAIDIQSTTTTLASLSRCITAETSLVIQLSNIPLIWERKKESHLFFQPDYFNPGDRSLTLRTHLSHIHMINSNNQKRSGWGEMLPIHVTQEFNSLRERWGCQEWPR